MTKTQKVFAAMAGVSLLVATQAGAQITYSTGDLLLNLRNTSSPTSGNDLEIDLGPVTSLSSGVVASSALVQSVFGAPSSTVAIGFSAASAVASGTSGTIWLSRADVTSVSGGVATLGSSPQQVAFSQQNPVTAEIGNMGTGATGGTTVAAGATTVSAGNGNSYQTQAQESSSASGIINYDSHISTTPTHGGAIETIQTGSVSDVYSALWEIPATGNGSDVYLGYFDFQSDGQIDFNAFSAVPEPATYALIGGLGLLGLAVRRQLRNLIA